MFQISQPIVKDLNKKIMILFLNLIIVIRLQSFIKWQFTEYLFFYVDLCFMMLCQDPDSVTVPSFIFLKGILEMVPPNLATIIS